MFTEQRKIRPKYSQITFETYHLTAEIHEHFQIIKFDAPNFHAFVQERASRTPIKERASIAFQKGLQQPFAERAMILKAELRPYFFRSESFFWLLSMTAVLSTSLRFSSSSRRHPQKATCFSPRTTGVRRAGLGLLTLRRYYTRRQKGPHCRQQRTTQ